MYSYDERMRAVELYIKLGKRVRATIRQLGLTCPNRRTNDSAGVLVEGYWISLLACVSC